MRELIAKLESAGAGSRELGHEVLLHFGWHRSHYGHFYGPLYQWSAPDRKPCLIQGDEDKLPNPTTSLDAALALAERVLPGWYPAVEPRFFIDGEVVRWKATVIRPLWHQYTPISDWFERVENRTAATAALAVCAAILRTTEQHSSEERA